MCKEIKVNKINVKIDWIDRRYTCQDCGYTISSSMEDGADAHRRAQDFAFRHVEETGHTVYGTLINRTIFFKGKDKPKEMAQRTTIKRQNIIYRTPEDIIKTENHVAYQTDLLSEKVYRCTDCLSIGIKERYNYCPVCGIRLKWED